MNNEQVHLLVGKGGKFVAYGGDCWILEYGEFGSGCGILYEGDWLDAELRRS